MLILLKSPGLLFISDPLRLLLLVPRGMHKSGVHFHGVGSRTLFVPLLGAVSSSVLSFAALWLLLRQLDPLLHGHLVGALCILSESKVFVLKD